MSSTNYRLTFRLDTGEVQYQATYQPETNAVYEPPSTSTPSTTASLPVSQATHQPETSAIYETPFSTPRPMQNYQRPAQPTQELQGENFKSVIVYIRVTRALPHKFEKY